MTPSSVTKMNELGPVTLPLVTAKPVEALNTIPVGDDPARGGTWTLSWLLAGNQFPAPSKTSDRPLPFSLIQKGPVGENATPHALTRLASVWAAGTRPSDTRLTWEYCA